MSSIRENILRLENSIRAAALAAGRRPEEIGFLLVTKTVPAEKIKEGVQAGAADFGENRVQELLAKKKLLAPGLRWHMIGHLQTNKVRQILGEVVLIHSLDRPELAAEIGRAARAKKIPAVDCLVQVNSTGEETKFGLAPEDAEDFVASLPADSPIRVKGLMTIGPLTAAEGEIRKAFRLLKRMQEQFQKRFPEKSWDVLSMGMSGDYRIAIEEGATLLRIGRAVFGERIKS